MKNTVFEVGKIYRSDLYTVCEVLKRTAKTITFQKIRHIGNFNEAREEITRAKLKQAPRGEYFYIGTNGEQVWAEDTEDAIEIIPAVFDIK
jgi:hypothetical protein